MSRLVVMGAGYVGMALLSYFRNQQHEIVVTTTRPERVDTLRPFGKEILVLQPNADKDLHELIHSCDGMVILVAPNLSKNYEETYLKTAKSVSSALKDRQSPFYLLYTSSTSVCEGVHDEWVTEERTLNPKSENAKILLEAERHYLNCPATACILRLGGIYGPKRELIDRARRFSGKELPGTGEEPTNHIHLDDIISAVAFCIDHSLKGIYHLVNDDHRIRKELYADLCKSIDIPLPLWNPNLSTSKNGGYKVSNQKIKEAGFIFKHPFIKTIE